MVRNSFLEAFHLLLPTVRACRLVFQQQSRSTLTLLRFVEVTSEMCDRFLKKLPFASIVHFTSDFGPNAKNLNVANRQN